LSSHHTVSGWSVWDNGLDTFNNSLKYDTKLNSILTILVSIDLFLGIFCFQPVKTKLIF